MPHVTQAARTIAAFAVLTVILSGCFPESKIVQPVGVWSESTDANSPSLSLHEDGSVTGFDGCNQLTGAWEPTDNGVNFKQLASTQVACPDVDTWLDGAIEATISMDTMTVSGLNDEEIGTLQRTAQTPAE